MRNVRRVLPRLLLASLALLPLFGAGGACSKKERQAPPGPPPLPALNASARDGRGPGAMAQHQMPADHPAMLRSRAEMEAENPSAPPAGAGAAAQAAPAGGGAEGSIRGSLKVADALKAKVTPGATIFLIARSALDGGGTGPVVAVQRYNVGAWPQPFELTQDNVMLAGMSLKGKVVLTARIDQDGDAMTKQPGDIEGATPPITVPAQSVELVFDKVRTEAAGAPSPSGMGEAHGQPGMGGGAMGMPAGHPAMPAGHPAMPAGHP